MKKIYNNRIVWEMVTIAFNPSLKIIIIKMQILQLLLITIHFNLRF